MSASTRIRTTLWTGFKLFCLAAVFGAGILLATIASAQLEDDGRCAYNRGLYPDGTQMCQGEQLMECDEGAWADVGVCDEPQPAPAPIPGGGDVEMD